MTVSELRHLKDRDEVLKQGREDPDSGIQTGKEGAKGGSAAESSCGCGCVPPIVKQ